ncbi:hypothetical protein LTR08_007610 [Meristemomyces frigidus]|nr:hypothetical protein LTR08_007610 [Meristemomyces frigidus]
MRHNEGDVAVMELLPRLQHGAPDDQRDGAGTSGQARDGLLRPEMAIDGTTRRGGLVDLRTALYVSLVVLTSAPVFTLIGLAPKLSHNLASNGCMSNGQFTLPYTASIWDAAHFWTITLAFVGTGRDVCEIQPRDGSYARSCTGYSFDQVKIIDLAWDVVLGRGGQALLAWSAYRLFRQVIAVLMERGEVGYDVFAFVAFNSGTLSSLVALLRHAVGWGALPQSRRALGAYAAMAAVTVYIIAMPTLFSAMTGYTSYYAPWVLLDQADSSNASVTSANTNSMIDCGASLSPAWGLMGLYRAENGEGRGVWNEPINYEGYYDWIDYYHRYASIYAECPSTLNLSTCAAANISTYVQPSPKLATSEKLALQAPMPGIITWPDEAPRYTHWDCGGSIIETAWLAQASGNATGVCQAGARYAWGFSFQLTLVVALLTMVFALIMCGLSLEAKPRGRRAHAADHGVFKDAVTMVTQAQRQYGGRVGEWSAMTLQKEVVKGKRGMSFASGAPRPAEQRVSGRRRRMSDDEFGDPLGGDWGGDVVVK